MGKATRERARRAAEAAALPELVVVEDPHAPVLTQDKVRAMYEPPPPTPTEPTASPKAAQLCPVRSCQSLGLYRHTTPDSDVIYLCGRCDAVARRNLREAADREELMRALAAPLERVAALRMKERSR